MDFAKRLPEFLAHVDASTKGNQHVLLARETYSAWAAWSREQLDRPTLDAGEFVRSCLAFGASLDSMSVERKTLQIDVQTRILADELRPHLRSEPDPRIVDKERVLAWAISEPRQPANIAFTEGPEREAAYWIESADWLANRDKPNLNQKRIAELTAENSYLSNCIALTTDEMDVMRETVGRLTAEVEGLRAEIEGLNKSNHLLFKGTESISELYDGQKHEIRDLKAENARLRAAVEWRPISESEPFRNGMRLTLGDEGNLDTYEGRWCHSPKGGFWEAFCYPGKRCFPTHFKPLPSPPPPAEKGPGERMPGDLI